MISCYWSSAKL